MHLVTKALAASALAFALPAFAAPNLVVNGGFETGDFSGWQQVNDTSFSGVSEEFFGVAPIGNFQAFFGPTDPGGGGILQTIDTVAGGNYVLTFSLANLGNPPNAYGVFWDGGFTELNFDLDEFPYTQFTLNLTASGTATDLGFIFYHEPSFFLLDGISLQSAIPEPATWAMMIIGFGAIGFAARRRQAGATLPAVTA